MFDMMAFNKFKVLSYNIWFDETLCLERTISLVNIIGELQPDVICLQEVRPDIHEILVMLLKEYKYSFPQKLIKKYECVTFSKHPIIKCLNYPYKNSGMGRSLSIIQLCNDNTDIIVANSHFESLFKKSENTIKLKQYEMARTLLDSLYESYQNVILCSDTNVMLHEEDKFNREFHNNKWIDIWTTKGNESNKFTYDSENNIYLKLLKDKYRSRIDRILFKAGNLDIDKFDLIKNTELEPSDHFGIYGEFVVL
jgi:exonuclease III